MLPREAEEDLPARFPAGEKGLYLRAVLSHAIRRMQESTDWPQLSNDGISRILEEDRLPTAAVQADNAIRWLGANLKVPGERSSITPQAMSAIIGAVDDDGVTYIIKHLEKDKQYVQLSYWGTITGGKYVGSVGLTVQGWERFEELQRSTSDSRTAFMAMSYANRTLADIVENHFKPAVYQTGFELRRLDDYPAAGLIDNRMRSEILASRFLVVDLTDENRGAYWEAGFAEGLAKPVFYTCEQSKFDADKTHFDTDHQYTIKWDKENPAAAAKELKNAIRSTLRGEAKLSDD